MREKKRAKTKKKNIHRIENIEILSDAVRRTDFLEFEYGAYRLASCCALGHQANYPESAEEHKIEVNKKEVTDRRHPQHNTKRIGTSCCRCLMMNKTDDVV